MENKNKIEAKEKFGYFHPELMKIIQCVCGNWIIVEEFLLFGIKDATYCVECNRVWHKSGEGLWVHTGELICDMCSNEKEELFCYKDDQRICSECIKETENKIKANIEREKKQLKALKECGRFDPNTVTSKNALDIVVANNKNGGKKQHETKDK